MSRLLMQLRLSTLPILIVICLAALTASYAYADGSLRPLATQIIGDPDAAVTGKLAVGTATPGNKALTVVGVIDFLGAGTVHNYFTQGGGNNLQINTNVDEANTVVDATRSQWKLVLGSSLDWFSIRRSPAGGTYNEDALFFIQGSTGNVGIATVDTGNGAAIPFTPQAKLHVQPTLGEAIRADGIVESSIGGFRFPDGTTQSSAAISHLYVRRTTMILPYDQKAANYFANCDSGDIAISGGFDTEWSLTNSWTAFFPKVAPTPDAEGSTPTGWMIEGHYDRGQNACSEPSGCTLGVVYAVCADMTP